MSTTPMIPLGMLPWECAVVGVPASLQSSPTKRRDWQAKVRTAARPLWPTQQDPLVDPLALTMVFFHFGEPVDADNMIKPTADALEGIVYLDDAQLDDAHGARRDLSVGVRLRSPTPLLAGALATAGITGQAFVYLRVTPPRQLEELLR